MVKSQGKSSQRGQVSEPVELFIQQKALSAEAKYPFIRIYLQLRARSASTQLGGYRWLHGSAHRETLKRSTDRSTPRSIQYIACINALWAKQRSDYQAVTRYLHPHGVVRGYRQLPCPAFAVARQWREHAWTPPKRLGVVASGVTAEML